MKNFHFTQFSCSSILLGFLLILGCTPAPPIGPSAEGIGDPRYEVFIDSYGDDSQLSKKKFTVLSGDSMVREGSFIFGEAKEYIRRILEPKGYVLAEKPNEADVAIVMVFGKSDPWAYNVTRAVPIYGQTGVTTTRKTETTASIDNPKVTTENTSETKPVIGIVGYDREETTLVKYTRYLVLTAYDNKSLQSGSGGKVIWNTSIKSNGASSDIRGVLPYLVVAGEKYYGRSSYGNKMQTIVRHNLKVRKLKASTRDNTKSRGSKKRNAA